MHQSRAAWQTTLAVLLSLGLIAGCQASFRASGRPVLALDNTPATLLAPQGLDWSLQRVSGRRLANEQQAHFKRHTLAFPTASTGWGGGVALSALGATGDTVPNGPAAAFRTAPADPLYNKLFFLSKGGKFIKVDRLNPATYTTLDLGKAFSRTYVTLSPASTRAYLLADDGTLFIVNTITMTLLATQSVAGGYGIAPYIDPYTSAHTDMRDEMYVAANDGRVHRFTVTATSATSAVTVTGPTTYAVATGVTPLAGTRKIAAPPVVLNGVIHVGDQGGNFHTYDTADTSNNLSYGVGAPINTAPAIEIQDGTYAMSDPFGAPKTVPAGTPIYAFVTAGPSCYWFNLHDASTTPSLPLRIDDNDSGKTFGYLLDYNFSTAGTVERLAAEDGGNINSDAAASPADQILPNYAANRMNDVIVPAETNVYDDGTDPAGGPIYSYLRWNSAASHPAGSIVTSAVFSLEAVADQSCRVPDIRTTSPYYKGTTSLWASNGLTNGNRPAIGTGNVGAYMSGGVGGPFGNVPFKKDKNYLWDVTSAFGTPNSRYALALAYNAGGDAVLWPWGPYNGATGTKKGAKKAYQVDAVRFKNNPLNADASAGVNNDYRPLLTLTISSTVLPTPSVETAPVIDAINKRVYAYYTNAVYSLNFASPAAWSDTDPSGTKHTLFNMAHYGVSANNAAGVGGKRPGGAFNNRTKFVGNYSTPVVSFDLSAMYVLSRTPATDGAAPTSWNYSLSKFNLPLNAGANRLVAGSPTYTGLPGQSAYAGGATEKEASVYMVVDPFTNAGGTGGNVYFALGNGRLYQVDR